jgi:hypothetical protein
MRSKSVTKPKQFSHCWLDICEFKNFDTICNKENVAELAVAVYSAATNQALPLYVQPPSTICSASLGLQRRASASKAE